MDESLYSPCDATIVTENAWKPTRYSCGNKTYLYWQAFIDGKRQFLHRLILGNPKQRITFRNGNTLDCRRENLLILTAKKTKSEFRGVKWTQGQWVASITYCRRYFMLGKFDTEEAAARAYDRAALRMLGPYASLNYGDEKLSDPAPASTEHHATEEDAGIATHL